jgi:hypothetical protein
MSIVNIQRLRVYIPEVFARVEVYLGRWVNRSAVDGILVFSFEFQETSKSGIRRGYRNKIFEDRVSVKFFVGFRMVIKGILVAFTVLVAPIVIGVDLEIFFVVDFAATRDARTGVDGISTEAVSEEGRHSGDK